MFVGWINRWGRRNAGVAGRLCGLLAIVATVGTAIAVFGARAASAVTSGPSCTIYWTGKTSTNWTTATNWSLTEGGGSAGRVPSAADYVCMSTSPTNATPTLASGSTAKVEGINWPSTQSVQPSLTVSGTLTIGDSNGVPTSTINQIDDEATLVIYKNETASTSNLTLNGTLEGPGTLTVNGPTKLGAYCNLGLSGTSNTGAHLITQGQTSTPASANVNFYEGSTLENQGTLNLSDGLTLYDVDGLGNKVQNDSSGIIAYNSTTGSSANVQITAPNAGAVNLTGNGTVTYGDGNASATDTGTFNAAAGTTLDLYGTRTEASGATITGSGLVDVSATTTLQNGASVTNTGTFQVDGTLILASGASDTAANLTLNGTLEGPGTLTVSGATHLGAYSDLGVNGTSNSGAHLITQGQTSTPASANVYFWEGSTLENQGNALNLNDGTSLIDEDGLGNKLQNDSSGTIAYNSTTGGSASLQITAPNAGAVNLTGNGTLDYGNGSASATDTGTFNAASGTTIDLQGTRTEASGATIAGAGTVDVTGTVTVSTASNLTNTGTFQVDGTLIVPGAVSVTAANLTLNGTLEGPGTLTVSGATHLGAYSDLGVNGTSNSGAHLITQGQTSTPASANVYFWEGSTLENQGNALNLNDGTSLIDEDGLGNKLQNDSSGTIAYNSTTGGSASLQITASSAGAVNLTGNGTLTDGDSSISATDTGTFSAASGTTLDLAGTRTEASTATIAGAGTVDVTGTATLQNGASVTNTGTFQVDGTLIVPSGASVTAANLTLNGALGGPGTLTVSGPAKVGAFASLGLNGTSGTGAHLITQGQTSTGGNTIYFFEGTELENQGTLSLSDGTDLADSDGLGNTLVNDSGATISYTGSTNSASGTLGLTTTNNGTLTAGKGTLAAGNLTNLSSGGTLTGGTYNANGGTISLASPITANAATIVLGASPSKFASGSNNALGTLASNSGSLDLKQSLTDSSAFANTGTVTVESGTFKATSFTQTAGTTTVDNGATLQAGSGTSAVAINGGNLTGNGTISGNLSGGGTVTPIGTVAGAMSVTGTYTASGGTLDIPISGASTAGTDYGQLSASKAASLNNGTLTLATANGYLPPIGTTYTILNDPAGISGTFSTVNGTQLPNRQYVLTYGSTSVTATVQALPPAVSSLSPTSGPAAGGTTVTITGTHLDNASAVNFGSTAATSYTVNSATQITATAPAGTGTVDVTVTTPGGTSATNSGDQFTYIPAPSVSNVTPSAGPTAGGTTVTITGTNLLNASGVSFGSTQATNYTVNSPTQITATSPTESAGTVDVTVTTPGGTSQTTTGDQFTFQAPPTVTGLNPTTGPTAGGTSVTITGTNLQNASGVSFGSTQATSYTVNSPTQITATSPAGSGTVDVTVTTPGGTSVTSSADQFTYASSSQPPTVTKVSPNAGPLAGGTSVTITGTNLTGATAVSFGTAAASSFTVNSATQITATSPAGKTGVVDITVTTPGGTSATGTADHFTYEAAPSVSALSPTSGPVAGGTTVTITGTGFVKGATVNFGPTQVASTYVSPKSIKAVSPAEPAGSVAVTVSTPGGTSSTTTKDLFAYGPPTLSSFSPASGITGATVTLTGTGFTNGMTVSFGSLNSPKLTLVSGTSLKAVVPNGDVASTITVSDGQGSATSTKQFTPTLSIQSFTPASGPVGTQVTINGVGFNSSSVVKFNGIAASSVTLVSANELQAIVPTGATTGPITVTNTTTPSGTVTSATAYTVG